MLFLVELADRLLSQFFRLVKIQADPQQRSKHEFIYKMRLAEEDSPEELIDHIQKIKQALIKQKNVNL